ncbi:MAG TPA: condensation domain-containing protein, partial [Kofleriaceae bacterium]|nr:condensation domain-containing protein [Kofleriaceae bacterium]
PEADFFELGGTSLLAMRAAGRLGRETGQSLPVLALFQARTVRRVAVLLAAAPDAGAPAPARDLELPPLAPRPDPTSWPLTSSQRISWELTHRGRQSVFEWPRRVFELAGPLDRAALRRAADAVVMRHPVLRARFTRSGGGLVQTVAPAPARGWHELDAPAGDGGDRGGPAPRELARLLERPFDLTAGPVIRFVLARASADRHWLGFAVHHIAFDGGSLAPFLADLSGAYRQLAAGREVAWSAPALALADVAAWEQAAWRTAGPAMAAYWRDQLAGARPPPLPRADPPGPLAHAPELTPARAPELAPEPVITRSFTLARPALDRLRRTAAALGATPFLVALTSFGATVRALTRSDDVCIASPYARRDLEAAGSVVGYMAHPLLFRLAPPAGASFARAVAHTGERVLGAYRHGQVPLVFGPDVLPGLPSSRALGGEALYRIFFNYLDLGRAALDLGPGLVAAPVDLGPESETRFPLMVFAVETEQALIWNVVGQARWYAPAQVAALAEKIGRDLERALADPLESSDPGRDHRAPDL